MYPEPCLREVDAFDEKARRILRDLAELGARSAETMARLQRLEVTARELEERRRLSVIDLRGLWQCKACPPNAINPPAWA